MASYVNLVLDVFGGGGSPAGMGYAKLVPSATLTDAPDQMWVLPSPVEVPFTGSADPTARLLATDASGPQPSGWTWGVTFPGVPGQPAGFSFFLPAGPASFTSTQASPAVFTWTPTSALTSVANGTGVQLASPPGGFSAGVTYYAVNASGFTFGLAATAGGPPLAGLSAGSGTLTVAQCNLSALAPAESGTAFASYMPEPSGTPSAGMIPIAVGSGSASQWGSPATGQVTSVFGRTGAVTAQSGDYTAAQVGADASGAAAAAQGNAETFATAAVAVETSRAEAAEALKAPLASPALTGSPTAPTQTTGDSSTKIATDAFVGTAVAAETSRAQTAEALLAPKASPALTGTPTAPTAAALTASTVIATTAYTDSAVAVETSRAQTAEALKAPLASPALTGTPTAPTATGGTSTTQLATTAFVAAAIPTALPPNGSAGGDLSGSYPNPTVAKVGGTAFTLPVSIANGGTGTGTGAPQNDVLAGPASGGAGAPSFRALVAADLPAATTSAQGAVQLDGTAADITALGTRAAGAVGKAADAGHVHPTTGVMAKVADTGSSGTALINGTQVILSWVAPSDGNLHFVSWGVLLHTTSTETGGQVITAISSVYSIANGIGANQGAGYAVAGANTVVPAGDTFEIFQSTALTGGASTLYAQIWAA